MTDKVNEILSKMPLKDKVALCSGKDFWHTKDFKKYGIPSIMLTDGPHGVRKQKDSADMLGLNESEPGTCFPTAVTLAATWNRALIQKAAGAIGEEAIALDVPVVLGPGVNIKRNPLCGRNFEYFSEDPCVAGEMGAAYVNGMQKTGIGTSLKHFAANSQEYKRFSSDSQIDERTLREIYLAGFETVVKKAQPKTVMCAYNEINGTYCSDNKMLLNDILRKEWGFEGLVVTDWGAMNDRMESFASGCDLSMPGGSSYMEKQTVKAVKDGRLRSEIIDKCAGRVLKLILESRKVLDGKNSDEFDIESHHMLAKSVADEGIVLLKNEGNALPIQEQESILLLGHMAAESRYQGAGSSHICPTRLDSVVNAMAGTKFIEACDAKGNMIESDLEEIKSVAASYDKVVVFAGLTDQYESEGFDRDTIEIPKGHIDLIRLAAQKNKNVIVVLMGGSVMATPFKDDVKAIIYAGLSGQAGALSIADIVYGKVNPSGKLTETWPYSLDDVVSAPYYAGRRKNAQYREGIYVGYRYYDKAKIKVNFPFGFGLSYTQFGYSDLTVECMDKALYRYRVSCTVSNTGRVDGAEVVQLYVRNPTDGIFRPEKELRGFEKVFLNAGESRKVSFELNARSFSIYHDGFKVPAGEYGILVGASCADIRLQDNIIIDGVVLKNSPAVSASWYAKPHGAPSLSDWKLLMNRPVKDEPALKKGTFTINNTLAELSDYSFIAKKMKEIIERQIAKGMGTTPDCTNPEFRMAAASSVDCSMRGMIISSCGAFPERVAKAIVEAANGHKLRALVKLIRG